MFKLRYKILISFLFCSLNLFAQNKINGTFIGLQRISEWIDQNGKKRYYGDSNKSSEEWYHQVKLKINNDSVWLEKSPIYFLNGKINFSASDGGFYYYSGIINKFKGKWTISLTLLDCDYCDVLTKFIPPKVVNNFDSISNGQSDTLKIANALINEEPKEVQIDPKVKYLTFFVERTKNNDLLVNKNILFKRKR